MYDSSEISSAVGRSKYELPEIRGRAMVKIDNVNTMQSYLPVEAASDIEYAGNIRTMIEGFNKLYPDSNVKGLPVLPEVILKNDIERTAELPPYLIPIGLDSEDVIPQMFDLRDGKHLIVGKPKTGRTNTLRIILSQIYNGDIFIVDSASQDLSEFEGAEGICYLSDNVNASGFIEKISAVIEKRKTLFEAQAGKMKAADFYRSLDPMVLLIDDGDRFSKMFPDAKQVAEILKEFFLIGGAAFVTTPMKGPEFSDIGNILKETSKGIILGAPSDTNPFGFVRTAIKAEMSIGYMMGGSDPIKVKMPFV